MSQTKAQLIDDLVQPLGHADGTEGAPTLSFKDDEDTGLFRPGDNTLGLVTGGSTRLTIDSSGRLLVGAASAFNSDTQSVLQLKSSTNTTISTLRSDSTISAGNAVGQIKFFADDETNAADECAAIEAAADGAHANNDRPTRLAFWTTADSASSPTERMRIDSAGRLKHGTTASVTANSEIRNVQIVTDVNNANQGLGIYAFTASNNAPRLDLGSSPNGTINDFTTVSSDGSLCGRINFLGSDGDEFLPTARIEARVDGTAGNGDMPGRLSFLTTADSGSSPTERMRITNSGHVMLLNTTSTIGTGSSSGQLQIFGGASNRGGQIDLLGAGNDGVIKFRAGTGSGTADEKMRLDSSGHLLVGTTRSNDNLRLDAKLAIVSTATGSSAHTGMSVVNYSNSSGVAPFIDFKKSRGTTDGGTTVVQNGDFLGFLVFLGSDGDEFHQAAHISALVDADPGNNDMPGRLVFSTSANGTTTPTERMRITQEGQILGGGNTGSNNLFGQGFCFSNTTNGYNGLSLSKEATDWGTVLYVHRRANAGDGVLIEFAHDTVTEGNINVNATQVTLVGAHLSRWSQLPGGAGRTEILRGTVLSNLDEMCEWTDAPRDAVLDDEGNEIEPARPGGLQGNEQLNRMKVSDVEGDKNVAGVFQSWDDDDRIFINDFYCAMTGDYIIRIAQGVTVERGDLLMSAGDGTAKPQDDDIIRSKTIAKVTSTNVSCTYDDGSYCVPCVLMAC